MALIVGNNSWVTVIEADSYLADKYDVSGWSTAAKDQLLVTAFYRIFTNPDLSILKTSTNERVKWAQIELAYWLLANGEDFEKRESLRAMGVTSIKIDDFAETYKDSYFILPSIVSNLLQSYLTSSYFGLIKRDVENFI
jgi:hypothetical protein